MGFFVLLLVIAVPFALWQIIDPRGLWRVTESWRFRDPDANEPSDAAYALARFGGVMMLVGLAVFGVLIFSSSRDDDQSREHAARPSPTMPPSYESPVFEHLDLGPGTMVGYRYPSELTIEFVVLQADAAGLATCSTGVGVYEHTNAVVVAVTRSYTDHNVSPSDPDRPAVDPKRVCTEESPKIVTRSLEHPLGDRPILTAAPFVAPGAVGLRRGPAQRPEPLAEVPEPGVVERLRTVRIDPEWRPVPLLAAEPEL